MDALCAGSQPKLSKAPYPAEDAARQFAKAKKAFKHGALDLEYYAQKQNDEFNERIFISFYDAYRIALDILLRLNGYKTRSSGGSHYYVITFGEEILTGFYEDEAETKEKLKPIFLRLKKINEARNKCEYSPEMLNISFSELRNVGDDIDFVLRKVGELIAKI
jgi:hypothetical protein